MKKILVVEDDAPTRDLLKSFLTGKGLEVQTAVDGLEALAAVHKSPPDLLLLDVILPKLDGYGLLRELKKDAKLRGLPVVVLTAREMMRDVFIQEGVKDFVPKPYDPEELYKTVCKYL
jgi:CheY-like chemotaxis protein